MQLQTRDANNLEQSHIETLIQDYIQRTPKSKKYAQDNPAYKGAADGEISGTPARGLNP